MNRITQNIAKEPACLPGLAYEHANHNTTDGIETNNTDSTFFELLSSLCVLHHRRLSTFHIAVKLYLKFNMATMVNKVF